MKGAATSRDAGTQAAAPDTGQPGSAPVPVPELVSVPELAAETSLAVSALVARSLRAAGRASRDDRQDRAPAADPDARRGGSTAAWPGAIRSRNLGPIAIGARTRCIAAAPRAPGRWGRGSARRGVAADTGN